MILKRILRMMQANWASRPLRSRSTYHSEAEDVNEQRRTHQRTYPPPPTVDPQAARHYEALEVPATATFAEIKAAYKRLVKKYHPDRFHGDPQKRQYAEVVTQRLNEAYAYFEQKLANEK